MTLCLQSQVPHLPSLKSYAKSVFKKKETKKETMNSRGERGRKEDLVEWQQKRQGPTSGEKVSRRRKQMNSYGRCIGKSVRKQESTGQTEAHAPDRHRK